MDARDPLVVVFTVSARAYRLLQDLPAYRDPSNDIEFLIRDAIKTAELKPARRGVRYVVTFRRSAAGAMRQMLLDQSAKFKTGVQRSQRVSREYRVAADSVAKWGEIYLEVEQPPFDPGRIRLLQTVIDLYARALIGPRFKWGSLKGFPNYWSQIEEILARIRPLSYAEAAKLLVSQTLAERSLRPITDFIELVGPVAGVTVSRCLDVILEACGLASKHPERSSEENRS